MQRQGGFPESDRDPFPTDPIRIPHTRPDQPEQPTADPTATTEARPVQYPPSDRTQQAADNVDPAGTYHGNWTDWVYPEAANEGTAPGDPERLSGTPADNYPLTEDGSPHDTGVSDADPPTDRLPRVHAPPTADHTAASESAATSQDAPITQAPAPPDVLGWTQPSTAPPWHRPAHSGTEQQHTAPSIETGTEKHAPAVNHAYRDGRAAEQPISTPQDATTEQQGAPTETRQTDPDTQRPFPSPEGKAALDRLRQQRTPETSEPIHPRGAYRRSGQRRWVPPVLGTMGAAALFAAAYVQFGGGDGRDVQPAEPTAADNRASTVAAPLCPSERDGNSLQGNKAGGDDSGTEAIFAFQHAYYVARSAEQARESVAPDAAVPPAPDIQQGINTIPMGTTHCLSITPGAFVGQHTVVITEHRPAAAPISYNPQLVTTEHIGGRTVISGIGPMP